MHRTVPLRAGLYRHWQDSIAKGGTAQPRAELHYHGQDCTSTSRCMPIINVAMVRPGITYSSELGSPHHARKCVQLCLSDPRAEKQGQGLERQLRDQFCNGLNGGSSTFYHGHAAKGWYM